MAKGKIRIGISGWTYAPWRGHFYPKGLPQAGELSHAASSFPSIEVNGTFYRLQRPESFARWAGAVPDDFVFAVKAPRFITHQKRLRDIEAPLANFFASGLLRLGSKLGPVLWQFPASFPFDAGQFEDFLARLPHDTEAARRLAERHDERLDGRAYLEIDHKRPLSHAVEIRSESFRDPAFVEMLEKHRVALVCADTVDWPRLMDLTTDFVYVRLHGSDELYRSGYGEEALDRWAERIRAWSEGRPMRDGEFIRPPHGRQRPRDVYVYFDNTDKRRAPEDARSLMQRLGIRWKDDPKAEEARRRRAA